MTDGTSQWRNAPSRRVGAGAISSAAFRVREGGDPREQWIQIASTNPPERVNRETRRRTDVAAVFPNDDAIIRLVGAIMLEASDEWIVARKYMSHGPPRA